MLFSGLASFAIVRTVIATVGLLAGAATIPLSVVCPPAAVATFGIAKASAALVIMPPGLNPVENAIVVAAAAAPLP